MNKVGLSYSRCILDIVQSKVKTEDVLVIIAGTNFDPCDNIQWKSIWKVYCGGESLNSKQEWHEYDFDNVEHEKLFRDITLEIYESGKLHQPRKFGYHPKRLPYHWLEVGPSVDELTNNPALKKAWEQFQIVSGLTES